METLDESLVLVDEVGGWCPAIKRDSLTLFVWDGYTTPITKGDGIFTQLSREIERGIERVGDWEGISTCTYMGHWCGPRAWDSADELN
ncbi:hypothetical protein LguiB_021795 [Lonicera macranthoides]